MAAAPKEARPGRAARVVPQAPPRLGPQGGPGPGGAAGAGGERPQSVRGIVVVLGLCASSRSAAPPFTPGAAPGCGGGALPEGSPGAEGVWKGTQKKVDALGLRMFCFLHRKVLLVLLQEFPTPVVLRSAVSCGTFWFGLLMTKMFELEQAAPSAFKLYSMKG